MKSSIASIPAPLRTTERVTRDTPIRLIGDCTKAVARGTLEFAASPLEPQFEAVFAAIAGHSVAALAIMAKETEYGRTTNGRNNPFNVLGTAGFVNYVTWAEGVTAGMLRFRDYTFKGGVYEPEISVAHFHQVFIGGPQCRPTYAVCANGETRASIELAITQFLDRANRLIGANAGTAPGPSPDPKPTPSEFRDVIISGSSTPLRVPAGLAFKQQLTPRGPNRSGRRLNWTGTTQHTTNNDNRGAGAQMHANWQNSGTPGHPDGKIGVHFYVDDMQIIQCIPIDEQGVHSGDWRNQQHTAVELCTNSDRNAQKAEANAVALQAGLLRVLGKTGTEAMHPHTQGGHCPRLSVPWSEWERRVDQAIGAAP